MVIVYIGTGYIQVLYLGRAPRTKETLPDFHEWRRVTRHPLVFHGLTGSQRTLGFWGVTAAPTRITMYYPSKFGWNFPSTGLAMFSTLVKACCNISRWRPSRLS